MVNEEVTQAQINDLEKFADRLLSKFDVDIEFTKHFADRMNDERNNPPIKISELQSLFKKIAKDKAKKIKSHPNSQVVLKDLQKDLNLPIVVDLDKKGEIEVRHKTIMRKKNFTTPNDVIKYESYNINEGVNDPGIFKAVFLAGGPGSGKSFIVGKTGLVGLGLKLVNSDPLFELGLKKANMTTNPDDIFSEKGQAIRNKAKSLTNKMQSSYLNGRLGLVIDGTGKDFEKIQKQKIELEKLGYETAMIFVNTNIETSLSRNKQRQRSLPDDQVKTMWKGVQNNIGKFQNIFSNNFYIVDNSDNSDYEKSILSIYKKISTWLKRPPISHIAKKWIKSNMKSINEQFEEFYLSEKIERALSRKSKESDIPLSIIKEVYNRGLNTYNSRAGITEQQWAFARVNSFIKGGKAREIDNDLMEEEVMQSFQEWALENPNERWHSTKNQRVIKMKKKGDMHHPSDPKDADMLRAVTGKDRLSTDDLKYAHGSAHRQGYKLHVESAGEEGTPQVTKKYKKDTPGQVHELNNFEMIRQRQKREKKAIETRHDRERDVARLRDTRMKNRNEEFEFFLENNKVCWDGYKQVGMKKKNGKKVPNCVPEEVCCERCANELNETVYQVYEAKNVTLNKPFPANDGKHDNCVYVKNDKGNIVKVCYGDASMKNRSDNPKARKSFRARHNCENPGPKWKARYWACKNW